MPALETYRGYEIHAELAGYGYLAHLPNYDGEACIHGWSVEAVRGEVDAQLADVDEFPEPSVNLSDAAPALKAVL